VSISAPEVRDPLLSINGLSAYYGELRALFDVSLALEQGKVLSIIGANGAGKSTLLRSLVGMMNRGATAHIRGEIEFAGRRIDGWRTEQIVDLGISLVPEGRRLFQRMTVEDNLLAGGHLARARAGIATKLEEIYLLFPKLRERREQVVAQMSGGEQQMVAIGRCLMSSPKLILFDELSLGLAPLVIEEIYRKVRQINGQGITCIIIEQDMRRALSIADDVCVMLEGSIVLRGKPADLKEDAISAAYFGTEQKAAHG
jgi:branched-chain amino acid transport system ATP-binding protein